MSETPSGATSSAAPAPDIRDNRPQGLLEAYDGTAVTGRIAYFVLDGDPAALVPVHTVVEPAHEGKGIAGALVRRFYAIAADEGVPVVPLCPYAVKWAQRHPDEAPVPPKELVAEAVRQLTARPDRW
ncbi:GNAT family N-acetyltransferase [Streptomyces yaizuensis]|uniref:N-acetyltransferase n=1 Tax=Streptomyces yaizuensis TaxID=2989713 RepID=A0ABQ5NQX9_9ACTN|nr:GNAT family N-acetyltransferase [Streptomyces sp. YSPA8]GLF92761.1 N-acetyltransferase [Streptomyces sp. YSPA8]